MKKKALNLSVLLASSLAYMEWGGGHQAFLFQAEAEVFSKLFSDPASVIHPFILIPLFGQLSLFISLFQKTPGKTLTYFGIVGLGILVLFLFSIGLLSGNMKIVLSTLPFIVVSTVAVVEYRR